MNKLVKPRKIIALFFLCLLIVQTVIPMYAWALTSGPAQPESKQFMAAGASDMVDLFTGDFKYNIPLLDIDGYPINLNYQSGVKMDDEASWVGLGWSLTTGAINRQLRGIPDDANGDVVEEENYTKPNITYGGRGTIRTELKGWGVLGLGGSLTVGIFSNNYNGIGAEFGANSGLSMSLTQSGWLTGRMGIGVHSSTADGVDVSPSISLTIRGIMNEQEAASMGISANLGYNTRQGLKDLTLSQSFSYTAQDDGGSGTLNFDVGGSTTSFNTPPFYPRAGVPYKSTNRTFSIDGGFTAWTLFFGVGVTGYKSRSEVLQPVRQQPAFGFMYAGRGKNVPDALMDFMREKDNPAVPNIPNIALPVATPDLFSYTGQSGSGQFRLYSGGSGVFFDPEVKSITDNSTLGGDAGFGSYFHGGITYYKQNITSKTGKWKSQNDFLQKGDFRNKGREASEEEDVYFKQVGERNVADAAFEESVQGEKVVSVKVSNKSASGNLKDIYETYAATNPYKKNGRQVRRTPISYLTAKEAVNAALDRDIKNFPFNNYGSFSPVSCNGVKPELLSRCSQYRKPSHISELTVLGDDGRRMVYGLPVYNIKQDEYTFAIKPSGPNGAFDNRVIFNTTNGVINHNFGTDEYYSRQTQPAYATSYLLTALLSTDYQDMTGDGISDDDAGTAVRFNYSKVNGVYKWRSPYEQSRALFNKALYADPDDDKASLVYGEKELWYQHSIETKTKIAYFITEDRDDALGVYDFMGVKNTDVRQKRLKEIRLYSKSDLTTPIKTVVFEYDYSLCSGGGPNDGIRNGANGVRGKLTLKSVYFKYASSSKGQHHPYTFEYNDAPYANLSTDRWGNYKPKTDNEANGWAGMNNDEFPYTNQQPGTANANAGAWLLKVIHLPTGGSVNVDYEADDYAFVQSRRSMQMIKINSLITGDGATTTNLADAKGFRLSVPATPSGSQDATKWFRKEFLNDQQYMYAKLFVHVTDLVAATGQENYDFVPCYGKVSKVNVTGSGTSGTADVYFEDVDAGGVRVNPFELAAWQKMRLEYPRYAYPGYRNRIQNDRPVEAALGALVNAIGNLAELRENFYKRAKRKGFASSVMLSKSFARMVKYDGHKFGGGTRVKAVRLKDSWQSMTGNNDETTYGQSYEYTTTLNGKEISSGVAAYEPAIGGDENPMRMPVPYLEQIKGGLNNYFYLEEPFGETLFPSPDVGYSKVTVRRLGGGDAPDPTNRTGWDVSEFYTARDYPVIVQTQPKPDQWNYQPSSWFSFFGGNVVHEQSLSQGYTIILNDMHGKPKAERSFNQSGADISSTVYYYKDAPLDATTSRLTNKVRVVDENGQISPDEEILGREIEMFVDMREQEMSNFGQSINLGVDVIPIIFGIPFPIPHWPVKDNNEYRLFRSASVLKTVQYFGVVDRVVKTIEGSTVTARTLLFDRNTGEEVLTSTQNEFNDPVYTLNIPAYWVYKQMGGAYKSLNNLLQDFNSGSDGIISPSFASLLTPGDELINVNDGERLWVSQQSRLIDETGKLKTNYLGTVKVCRSGYRNMLTSSAGSITCLKDPLENNTRIGLLRNEALAAYKVLDAKATLFDEAWGMPGSCDILPCPGGGASFARQEEQTQAMSVPDPTCYNDNCPPGYVSDLIPGKCVILPQEDTRDILKVCNGDQYKDYGRDGAVFYDASGNITAQKNDNNTFWRTCRQAQEGGTTVNYCGRLNEAGVWLCGDRNSSTLKWWGFNSCFDAPVTQTYYIGFAADNRIKIYIDNVLFKELDLYSTITLSRWYVYPLQLDAGHHTIRVLAYNDVGDGVTLASIGVEVYNNSYTELLQGNSNVISGRRLFSTRNLVGQQVPTFINESNGTVTARYSCNGSSLRNPCGTVPYCRAIGRANVINPWLLGYLGNWRPSESKVYEVNRVDRHMTDGTGNGVYARNSGYYQSFVPLWYVDDAAAWHNSGDRNWVSASYVTLYDRAGQEVETKDALNKYSAALYAFKNTLPAAVGVNSMQRELYYEGFDDYFFNNNCTSAAVCNPDSFSIRSYLGGSIAQALVPGTAHTGNYSLKLQGAVRLRASMDTREYRPGMFLNTNTVGEYYRMGFPGLYPTGFNPVFSKKYIFSAWVKDGQPRSQDPGIVLQVNGTGVQLKKKAVVEGWKLVEGVMDLGVLATNGALLDVVLQPAGGSVNLDDIRIFPYDAQLKTFAYDDRNMRLMAELDENNLATFYEYDDEGSLIRVKKETDRGIITVRETRSAYIRQ
ncbi:hypothetical protein L3C95_26220 [Chitinophaga filiformis]|uniref:hypothetical protein n=1 Tax=Chitinophaga filiformis TaxID=104663 RepID=UPI001F396075|nr:hypothetical protein [Chitinophaga filiformis]MCF6406419.1 hypothetical protein [Chitinophaga filiformis]